ncbi:ArsR family transcriptional regulator [Agromyces sp. Root81]|uniref:transcriptional regulator n=1 Tax=Agromyces sp. Root81 TaxID=1736601 RepID=UPI0006F793B5|nr:transcriptional regulator [Agromyces sp. Root81]KRC62446.1 ArsR family transcriptional regulator [Agromyces sp. Root81]
MSHPRHDLDEALLTPVRLSLMAALTGDAELDFATLRSLLEVDDSVLSKAISYLERVGYVHVAKGTVSNRPRTWVASTVRGRRALAAHVRALRAITGGTRDP